MPWRPRARPAGTKSGLRSRRSLMRRLVGLVLLMLGAGAALAADPSSSLASRKAHAAKEQQQLRQRIQVIQKEIDSRESSRHDAASDLKASESAISTINRRLARLAGQTRGIKSELSDISAQMAEQHTQLAHSTTALAETMRAPYSTGPLPRPPTLP